MGGDEARYQCDQCCTSETPELYFDRRWAMELIGRVRQCLWAQYEARAKSALHDSLAPLLSSVLPETERFADIAPRLDQFSKNNVIFELNFLE